jgi:DNA-packaging protein gp3
VNACSENLFRAEPNYIGFGRPSEYDPIKHPAGVASYIELCKQQSYLPTLEGLAVRLGVARQTLYDWGTAGSERYQLHFPDILEQLTAAQASQLVQNGLINNYNPTITKLMLTKHGYRTSRR